MSYLAVLLLCAALFGGSAEPQPPPPADTGTTIQLSLDPSFTEKLRLAQTTDASPEGTVKPDVHFVPTPQQLVDVMLQMAEVKKDDVVYDLGCGDGRMVIRAAKMRGARGVGIDIDPQRIAEAKENAAKAGLEGRVEFRQADLFKSDFKDATVITLYLLNDLNVRLRPQIFAQVKPGTRVVSHAFRMGDWEPDAERTVKIQGASYDAYLWVVPANMSGRWKVSADRAVKGIPQAVMVEQTFQKIVVRSPEGAEVIGEGRLSGNEFTLTLNTAEDRQPMSFTGTVNGNNITAAASGKRATWKAQREPGTERPIEPAASPTPAG